MDRDDLVYDLLIKGGTLIDATQGLHALRDIAFREGTVAAVAPSIPAKQAAETIDASGKLVSLA